MSLTHTQATLLIGLLAAFVGFVAGRWGGRP